MSEHHLKDDLKGALREWDHAFYEAESIVERIIYGKRLWVLLAFLAITLAK